MNNALPGTRPLGKRAAATSRLHAARVAALWWLDQFFPPDPSGFMAPEQITEHEVEKASTTMGGYLAELGSADIDVLDFGCGWGGETLWLADRVRSVVGVDVEPTSIEQAQRALLRTAQANCRFEYAADGVVPLPSDSVDAVFSTNTFEHVLDLDQAFSEIHRVLKPGGVFLSRFGPLFYSPHGYHLYWACQVPYAHLLFGLDAILELRKARSGEDFRARSWAEMGLNCKRFTDFEQSARATGFELVRFAAMPVRQLTLLTKLPHLGDLFVFGIDCHLRKPLVPTATT